MAVAMFEDKSWQMSLGERAAIVGILADLRPALGIEIGSAQGGCLQHLAAYCSEVHSFDLSPPSLPVPDNVIVHTGDSHELLPAGLEELAAQGRNVDLAIVDGDHSPEGVRRDMEDLLDSAALRRSVILAHDSANPRVREGLDAVRYAAWPKVAHVELDWIPGRLFQEPALRDELWYGLALVMVDQSHLAYLTPGPHEQRYYPAAPLLREAQEELRARYLAPGGLSGDEDPVTLRRRLLEQVRELSQARMRELELQVRLRTLEGELEAQAERVAAAEHGRAMADRVLGDVMDSASWKLTRPLRLAKRVTRGADS